MAQRTNLIQLPLKRDCGSCVHFAVVEDEELLLASHCTEWDQPLDDESLAQDCEDYERNTDVS